MLEIIFPLATMGIGFLLGIIFRDCVVEDKRMDALERKLRKLERRLNG